MVEGFYFGFNYWDRLVFFRVFINEKIVGLIALIIFLKLKLILKQLTQWLV